MQEDPKTDAYHQDSYSNQKKKADIIMVAIFQTDDSSSSGNAK